MLSVNDLHGGYGALQALRGVDLAVGAGEIVAVLGANGAGKSSLLNTLAGLLVPWRGGVVFAGRAIHGLPAHAVSRAGIALVPEGRQLFGALSVRQNLAMGSLAMLRRPWSPWGRRERAQALDQGLARVAAWFPVLAERSEQAAGLLSGGQQQMLAVARALMSRPRLLMLDEPSLGLSPLMTAQLLRMVRRIRDETGCGVLMVEQNSAAALQVAERACVMAQGRIAESGSAADVARSLRARTPVEEP